MLIIGCDFHSGFQQLAIFDNRTGEVVEKKLLHPGEAMAFYRGQQRRYGWAWSRVRRVSGSGGCWASAGMSCGSGMRPHSGGRDAAAEDGPAGCRADLEADAGRAVSAHLGAVGRGARCAAVADGPASSDADADAGEEPVAVAGAEPGTAEGAEAVVGGGAGAVARAADDGTCGAAAGSVAADGGRAGPASAELDVLVRRQAEGREDARRLMTHPGVGPQTALGMVLTIGEVGRFAGAKQVASYLGLTPREHTSGGKQRLGHISKQGSSLMRFLLVEAGQSAVKGDAQLRRAYRRLAAKKSRAVAKVMVARRLAVRLYWMLRRNWTYAELARHAGEPGSFCGEQ